MKRNKIIAVALENSLHLAVIIFILTIALQSNITNYNNQIAKEQVNENTEKINEVAENKISRENQDTKTTARHMIARTKKEKNDQVHEEIKNDLEDQLLQELEAKLQERFEQTYYIKPEEVTISVDMDLTQKTGLSKKDFKELISNVKFDTSKFFYDNSDLIYDLCQEYNINEIFFCGLISAESGWNIASNHRRTYNYISLMTSSGLIQFDSIEDGLESAAKALHNNYLSEGARFYCGKTLSGVKTRFCPASDTWVGLVYGRMQQIINNK